MAHHSRSAESRQRQGVKRVNPRRPERMRAGRGDGLWAPAGLPLQLALAFPGTEGICDVDVDSHRGGHRDGARLLAARQREDQATEDEIGGGLSGPMSGRRGEKRDGMETGKLQLLPDRHTDFVFSVSASSLALASAALAIAKAVDVYWWIRRRRKSRLG